MPLIKKFSCSGGFAVFDGHVVICTIKANKHFLATRDERAFKISGMIVNIIPRVIAVVQVQVAAVVFAHGAVAHGIVTDHSDIAAFVIDIVLAIFLDIIVEPRLFDIYDIVLAVSQVEGHAAQVNILRD